MSELEEELSGRERHLTRLEENLSSRTEDVNNLKRSYETVSRTLEQTVSSQSRLRDALSQGQEREREGELLSQERLTQLKSAETKLFDTQVNI